MAKHKQLLTEREQEALTWARANYRHWRKRFGETLTEHMAALPAHMRLPDYYPQQARRRKVDLWRFWYFRPFGENRWNVHVQIVRRLLREGRV